VAAAVTLALVKMVMPQRVAMVVLVLYQHYQEILLGTLVVAVVGQTLARIPLGLGITVVVTVVTLPCYLLGVSQILEVAVEALVAMLLPVIRFLVVAEVLVL
jgi:hypothetical protein